LNKDADRANVAADPREANRAHLLALARSARLALLWERAWPPLAWALAIVALFFAASWFGLWLDAPSGARMAGVALFAAGLIAALFPLARLRLPGRAAALARLDRDADRPNQPASSSFDAIAAAKPDAATRALWDLHQRRLASEAAAIAVAPPSPRMVERDSRALRFAAVALALAAGFFAGPEKYSRIAAAFDWRGAQAIAAGQRLDAWIDPPTYSGRPPIMLDASAKVEGERKVAAPVGSIVIARGRSGEVSARAEGALAPIAPAAGAKPDAIAEQRWTLKGDGKLIVMRDGAPAASFTIAGIANQKPTIALTAPPKANLRGSLTLSYRLADQYGIASAKAEFGAPQIQGKRPPGRSLVAPPQMDLQLSSSVNGAGEAQTTADLSDHPWAGARVTMILKAHDLAGEDGASEPREVILPQRNFVNQLARALVEQRRDLILDPDNNRKRVGLVLDALLIAPELFEVKAGVYLGLRDVRSALGAARTDADLIGVADKLWAMALRIEEGDASQAQRDLRAAEQRLREALQRGASDEEIRQLMKELRDAAQRFASELAQQQPQDGQETPEAMDEKDLNALMDKMEDTARNGARQDAQAMLDQLQDMFENLKSARDQAMSPQERELQKQIGELEKLLRDQQALRDDTFRSEQRDRRKQASPDSGDNAQQDQQDSDSKSLEQRQQALRDRLAELQKQLKRQGLKGEKGFNDADGAMSDAQGDLKEGEKGAEAGVGPRGRRGKSSAIESQGRAMQALRDAAQGLQQQLQGQGQGKGNGATAQGRKNGQGRNGRDPLGRGPDDNRGGMSEGQLNEGAGATQRARRVMDELRRRLADPNRPGEERDYLERLLKRP
jgi:uncharacterized protein (TIGR02302 family)